MHIGNKHQKQILKTKWAMFSKISILTHNMNAKWKLGIPIESISIDTNLQNNTDTKWRFKHNTNQTESENPWYQFWNSKTILKDRYQL